MVLAAPVHFDPNTARRKSVLILTVMSWAVVLSSAWRRSLDFVWALLQEGCVAKNEWKRRGL
jgi:hypothetical protein